MFALETATVTLDLTQYVLDEVVLLTLCWLLTTPWAALFLVDDLERARKTAVWIGGGVPLAALALYILVGVVRMIFTGGFLW